MHEKQVTQTEGASISGKEATLHNLNAAVSLANQIRTTYGPRGRDKLIVGDDGSITISNDGATILKLLKPKNPIAKLLVKLSASQDAEIGDGTTGVVLLAANLCEKAHELVNLGYHPHIIINGYKMASKFVLQEIDKLQRPIVDQLEKIVSVPLNSKVLSHDKDFFTRLILDGMKTTARGGEETSTFGIESIQILKVPGASLQDSYLIDGIVFQRTFTYAGYEQQSKRIENPKILLLNQEIELKHQKEFAHLMINNVADYEDFVNTEWQLVYRKIDQMVQTGCNLILDMQGIGDLATQHFVRKDITNISRVEKRTMIEISKSVAAPIHSSLEGLQNGTIVYGTCDLFEEVTIGEEQYCILSGCPNKKTVTLILRGSSDEILQEAERSIHDAICVLVNALKHPWYVYGGGATETTLRAALHDHCNELEKIPQEPSSNPIINLNSKHQRAQTVECMRVFGDALQELVATIAHNAQLNSGDIIAKLNYIHHQKLENAHRSGINIETGLVDDMEELCVLEPSGVKKNAIASATEAACLILSIDHVVAMPRFETEEAKSMRLAKERKEEKQRAVQQKQQKLLSQHQTRLSESFTMQ